MQQWKISQARERRQRALWKNEVKAAEKHLQKVIRARSGEAGDGETRESACVGFWFRRRPHEYFAQVLHNRVDLGPLHKVLPDDLWSVIEDYLGKSPFFLSHSAWNKVFTEFRKREKDAEDRAYVKKEEEKRARQQAARNKQRGTCGSGVYTAQRTFHSRHCPSVKRTSAKQSLSPLGGTVPSIKFTKRGKINKSYGFLRLSLRKV